ncbi:MAG: hypothetical protein GKR94_24085 [Gammaproteobacteria bacterium]|nr:hypothetical protein [Gammaproteobacteria bacterium]
MQYKARLLLAVLSLTINLSSHGAYALCTAPPPVPDTPSIQVSNAGELAAAVKAMLSGGRRHIVLAPGRYVIPGELLHIRIPNVTIRGRTGNRDDVIVRGLGVQGITRQIFLVSASNVTLRDMTVGWVKEHAVQVQGEKNADNPKLINLRFVNTGQQMLKVTGLEHSSDNGLVQDSLFEFPDGAAKQDYTGGIDAHQARNWNVAGNTFKNIRSPNGKLAEHAIHFWSGSAGTIVERNVIVNADRGIGFGLGARSHEGGVIRNNFVHVTRDVGIGLESAANAYVAHNTVVSQSDYPNAIEYRFSTTEGVTIAHNLTIGAIRSRQGGSAELINNVDYAQPGWFADVDQGDLHLALGIPNVRAAAQHTLDIQRDIDCDLRTTLEGVDIGADQTRLSVDASLAVEAPSPIVKELDNALVDTRQATARVVTRLRSDPKILFFCSGWRHALFIDVVVDLGNWQAAQNHARRCPWQV